MAMSGILEGAATPTRTTTIRRLNDELRKGLPHTTPGQRFIVTAGLGALSIEQFGNLLSALRLFDAFTPDNDPYGEHDFGALDFEGKKYFWKIDYYDRSLEYGSPHPADSAATIRVFRLMLASEY
jgi:hypothetical protein